GGPRTGGCTRGPPGGTAGPRASGGPASAAFAFDWPPRSWTPADTSTHGGRRQPSVRENGSTDTAITWSSDGVTPADGYGRRGRRGREIGRHEAEAQEQQDRHRDRGHQPRAED